MPNSSDSAALAASLIKAAAWHLYERPFDGSNEDERLRRMAIRLAESADAVRAACCGKEGK